MSPQPDAKVPGLSTDKLIPIGNGTKIAKATGQPQINADIRIDTIHPLMASLDREIIAHREYSDMVGSQIDAALEAKAHARSVARTNTIIEEQDEKDTGKLSEAAFAKLHEDEMDARKSDANKVAKDRHVPVLDHGLQKLFSNTKSFGSWSKTRAEMEAAASAFTPLPESLLARMLTRGASDTQASIDSRVAQLQGLLRLMFQYMIHGSEALKLPQAYMKDFPLLSKSNMGLAARQIGIAKRVPPPDQQHLAAQREAQNDAKLQGVAVNPLGDASTVEIIVDMLCAMTGRQRDERILHGQDDVAKIEQWVQGIVEGGDDPLASLDDKTPAQGRMYGEQRKNYPTSLGGLPLARQGPIPELIVEFRRAPEIPLEEWADFAVRWFMHFEHLRTT